MLCDKKRDRELYSARRTLDLFLVPFYWKSHQLEKIHLIFEPYHMSLWYTHSHFTFFLETMWPFWDKYLKKNVRWTVLIQKQRTKNTIYQTHWFLFYARIQRVFENYLHGYWNQYKYRSIKKSFPQLGTAIETLQVKTYWNKI